MPCLSFTGDPETGGGELILSFPNYSNMERRAKFLFTGTVSRLPNAMSIHEHYTDDPDALFRQLLLFPQVYFSLLKNNFTIISMAGDKLKYRSLVLLPLWFLIKILQLVHPEKQRTSSVSNGHLLSPCCLEGTISLLWQEKLAGVPVHPRRRDAYLQTGKHGEILLLRP